MSPNWYPLLPSSSIRLRLSLGVTTRECCRRHFHYRFRSSGTTFRVQPRRRRPEIDNDIPGWSHRPDKHISAHPVNPTETTSPTRAIIRTSVISCIDIVESHCAKLFDSKNDVFPFRGLTVDSSPDLAIRLPVATSRCTSISSTVSSSPLPLYISKFRDTAPGRLHCNRSEVEGVPNLP